MVENLLPAQWMFVTKSLLERVGRDTGERVKGNSGRLVSRYDWHVTLLHLSTLPYMQLTAASALYQSWQNQSPALHPISLFLEAIPSTRTCSDVAIPLYLCMCFDYHLADRSHEHTGASIASRAVEYINTRVRDAGELCEVVEGKGVVRVLVRELGQEAYYYKVRFAVVGSVALFEAIALVAPDNVFELYAEESSDTHFLTPNTLIQLNEVTRVDEYSGVCEELGKSASIPPSFCLCKLPYPSPLPASIRPPVLSVLSRLTLLHAPTGIPCDLGCSYAGFTCAVWAFPLLNHTDILSLTPQIYRLKDQTYHSFASLNAEMSPTLTPGLQLTSDSQGKWLVSLSHSLLTCELKSLTGQLLCPCY